MIEPEEDSPDFTPAEAVRAVKTSNVDDLGKKVAEFLKAGNSDVRWAVSHELRRHKGHLFYRAKAVSEEGGAPRMQVFAVDWLKLSEYQPPARGTRGVRR